MTIPRCLVCGCTLGCGEVCSACRSELGQMCEYIRMLDNVDQANKLEELVWLPIWLSEALQRRRHATESLQPMRLDPLGASVIYLPLSFGFATKSISTTGVPFTSVIPTPTYVSPSGSYSIRISPSV